MDLVDINGFSHSVLTEQLPNMDTLHINLLETEENLFHALHKKNRKQIKNAQTRDFTVEVITSPTKEDLKKFQKLYNEFARGKKTYTCNAYHMDTMYRLIKQDALVLTKLKNNVGETLCYRIYVTDGNTVMSLYSLSLYRERTIPEEKRLLSEASRYLLWSNILYFKKTNHKIYDMGGLTDNPNIRSFKMEFGGSLSQVYSGYAANSGRGKLVLWLRKMTMRKG